MELPKYTEFYRDFLNVLAEVPVCGLAEIRKRIIEQHGFTEEERSEKLPSGKQTVLHNRISWAGVYLYKAGLVQRPARGTYTLSDEGKRVQQDPNILLDNDYLLRYPSFAAFQNITVSAEDQPNTEEGDAPVMTQEGSSSIETPQDTIDVAFQKINQALADELMQEVMSQDSDFFERLVVRLLLGMGYGGPFEDAGITTQRTGDGGIDGIIKEDKLGFSQIYIQAKRWDPGMTVSRPEIQKFSGALRDEGASKGLFITTAKFSSGAKESARRQHIVLVDGELLTKLMIEYNIGVSVAQTYSIKKLDTDFFDEEG
jgi:restriction system protein